MQISQWLADFWNANSGNIVASLIPGFFFFVLGPIGVWFSGRRIRQERRRKAQEALLDILEGMLVNQEALNEHKIASLFRAVEREVDVDLGSAYSADDCLDDLTLRFEKSKHLDRTQKDKFYLQIKALHEQMAPKPEGSRETPLPRPYGQILSDLATSLSRSDVAAATPLVEELTRRLVRERASEDMFPNIFRIYRRLYERHPFFFAVTAVVSTAAYAYWLSTWLR